MPKEPGAAAYRGYVDGAFNGAVYHFKRIDRILKHLIINHDTELLAMKLIYGLEPPKISFKQSPQGTLSFEVDNERFINIQPEPSTLTWRHVYYAHKRLPGPSLSTYKNGQFVKKDPEELMRVFSRFTSELQGLIESTSEKQFFSNYVNNCLLHTDPWGTPALIPQVWVNWIHYDSRDRNRAKRTQREPFRVDFVIKDQEISEDLAVIEIDGQSHFCEYRIDPVGNPTPYASMDSFVQHIQKDRWLRKQGWQVFRITTLEVEQSVDGCQDFENLFHDVFGKWLQIPF